MSDEHGTSGEAHSAALVSKRCSLVYLVEVRIEVGWGGLRRGVRGRGVSVGE